MIKKIALIGAASLLLTSCSSNNVDSNSKSNNNLHSDSGQSNSNIGVQFIEHNRDYYKNGVIYGQEKAMFLDFDSMVSVPLCAMPNCNHTNSTCLANICGTEPVMYHDYAYFFSSNYGDTRETKDGPEFFIDSKLMRASLETSEIETICEFDDCAPPLKNEGSYVLDGSRLYFIGDNCCPEKDEFGTYSWCNVGGEHYLCCIDIDTGKYTNFGSIYDGDKEFEKANDSSCAFIKGICNDKMYIQYAFLKEEPAVHGDVTSEDWTRVNFEYDLKNNKLSESELPAAAYVDNDTYVYLDYSAKETVVIKDDETYHVPYFDQDIVSVDFFNNKLFFNSAWCDLTDLSEHSLGKYDCWDVVAYYNNCYIMSNGGKCVKLTGEELLALDKG